MKIHMVAVVGSSPQSTDDWCRVVATAGATPAATELHTTAILGAHTWLVALDHWQAPVTYGFWLRSLPAPIILVTPHTLAAQALISQVPQLKIITPPGRALTELGDMLLLAMAGTAGALVVPAVPGEAHAGVRRGAPAWA